MNPEILIPREVSQRTTNIIMYRLKKKKKKATNELIYKIERVTDIKNKLMAIMAKRRKDKLEEWY